MAAVVKDRHAIQVRLEFCKLTIFEAREHESLLLILHLDFLVRLLCQHLLDHSLCVDITRGFILNSAEQYPLSLTFGAPVFARDETGPIQKNMKLESLSWVGLLDCTRSYIITSYLSWVSLTLANEASSCL